MRRTVIIIASTIAAAQAAREALEFLVLDAGSLEARQVRKHITKVNKVRRKMESMGHDDLVDFMLGNKCCRINDPEQRYLELGVHPPVV